MSKIKVHLLNSWNPSNSHIEIVLEQESKKGKYYYKIDAWSEPKSKAEIDDKLCLKSLKKASESTIIEIDNDLNNIITAWNKKYEEEYDNLQCFSNNCADVSAWFLEEFANIPNPGKNNPPFTINYVCCGLFAPSFLQCCTLPGRVFDYASSATSSEITEVLNSKHTNN